MLFFCLTSSKFSDRLAFLGGHCLAHFLSNYLFRFFKFNPAFIWSCLDSFLSIIPTANVSQTISSISSPYSQLGNTGFHVFPIFLFPLVELSLLIKYISANLENSRLSCELVILFPLFRKQWLRYIFRQLHLPDSRATC